jgi:hypothetical protein
MYINILGALIAYFPRYDMDRIESDMSNRSFIVAYAFIASLKFLLSHCLAMIRDTRIDTWTDGRDL